MSTNWLRAELAKSDIASITSKNFTIEIVLPGRTEIVYCPNSDEYRITADVTRKAKELGATIIAYSETWCAPTFEGKEYAAELNVNIMKYASFFAYLKKKGVKFSK